MKFVNISGFVLNLDQVVVLNYDLESISPELDKAGIFDVIATVTMSTGDDFTFSSHGDLMILASVLEVNSHGHVVFNPGTFEYYVANMMRYYKAVEQEEAVET